MKVSELQKKIGLDLLNEMHDQEISGVFISDMVSDIIAGMQPGSLLVTIQTAHNLIATANLADAAA
ncbi:MAG TPA: serine kinase, partial [bacterium]